MKKGEINDFCSRKEKRKIYKEKEEVEGFSN